MENERTCIECFDNKDLKRLSLSRKKDAKRLTLDVNQKNNTECPCDWIERLRCLAGPRNQKEKTFYSESFLISINAWIHFGFKLTNLDRFLELLDFSKLECT